MSINDATRFDWDRASGKVAGNLNPTLLDKYIELADEEQRQQDLLKSLWDDEEEEEDEDVVNHPHHYNAGIIECIEAIEESMTPEAYKGYLKGNCMKYLWRYDYKGKPVEDLEKAQWYLSKLLNVVDLVKKEKSDE
jgi:hypothetical protein